MAEQTIATSAKKWARQYETVYILKPTVSPDDAKRIADRVQEVMTKGGAKITKVETWGVRKLAYPIARHTRGVFIYVRFASYGEVPAELERNLRLLEPVMRYQTIVMEGNVDLDGLQVDTEETAFEDLEEIEAEEELTTAQQLGMEERREEPAAEAAEEGDGSEEGEGAEAGADADAGEDAESTEEAAPEGGSADASTEEEE